MTSQEGVSEAEQLSLDSSFGITEPWSWLSDIMLTPCFKSKAEIKCN